MLAITRTPTDGGLRLGSEWNLFAGICMTTNLPGHPMSPTQHFFV